MQTRSAFGQQLKHWRQQRGVSQLQLSMESGMSQRHVSFLETGRSRPGADVIRRLSDALDIPLRERNALLTSAGLPRAYPEKTLDDEAIAPFRSAIARMLENHMPYPAFVINRWWDVVDVNAIARVMFPADFSCQPSGIDLFLGPGPLRDGVENIAQVAHAFMRRLRAEHRDNGPDQRMEEILERAESYVADLGPEDAHGAASDLVICPRLNVGDQTIETFSMIARFGNTQEVTIDELRVELLYPRDASADTFFRQLADSL